MSGEESALREYERAVLEAVVASVPVTRETPDFIHSVSSAMLHARPLLAAACADGEALERVRELADEYDRSENWRTWGVPQSIRAALEAAS